MSELKSGRLNRSDPQNTNSDVITGLPESGEPANRKVRKREREKEITVTLTA